MTKIVAQCRKPTYSTQHYLITLPKTYPTLIHRGEDPSRLSGPIAHLKSWGCSPPWLSCSPRYYYEYIYVLKRMFSLLQIYDKSICSKKSPEIVGQRRKLSHNIAETYPVFIYGRGTLLGPCHESAVIAYLNKWRVSHLSFDQLWHLLLISLEFKFDGVVPADIIGYAIVLTNKLISISSDGQRLFDLFLV